MHKSSLIISESFQEVAEVISKNNLNVSEGNLQGVKNKVHFVMLKLFFGRKYFSL